MATSYTSGSNFMALCFHGQEHLFLSFAEFDANVSKVVSLAQKLLGPFAKTEKSFGMP